MSSGEMFECGPSLRIEAQERLTALQFAQLNTQLGKIEEMMERLERRLWLTVYGVVGVILAQAFESILTGTV
ncbi:GTA head formation protein, RCAP_rcc01685 family [Pseudooctadecabacter jejudonensis]|uniref:Gene transfer agent protein n=1 Tax=Pseudooctadecabacter jejudonensis TaxID=1391910 RepID=A0A1Y5TAZ0_9RHOB|nr:hypothetical protein [Pseudooctadecabacter jejudonensis]SLN59717.1 hypothetical protein PSJ8397_03177 [Pseudooctadecabacter jejudonensis]